MKSFLLFLLMISILTSSSAYNGSTTAAVTLAGGIIKAKQSEQVDKKYKRKDCPVCKGKGWYMSGDGIKKIDCQYCEPDSKDVLPQAPAYSSGQKDENCKTIIIKR